MDVTRIPVEVATRAPGGRTNVYCLGNDDALLVDPAARSEEVDAAVADCDVAHVAVTHHHPDHVGAVEHYARACGATVWARAGRTGSFAEAALPPDRTFRPGTAIPTGDGPVCVLDTPGHAPEHVAFEWGEGAAVGDVAVAEGSVVVGGPGGDVRAYLTSLRRLRARGYDALHPGHGPVIEDARAACERLIRHRLDRERRVRAAVRGGAGRLDEVVEAAYGKDLSGVRDLARATVACHLEKLAVEGDLRWDGERAEPVGGE